MERTNHPLQCAKELLSCQGYVEDSEEEDLKGNCIGLEPRSNLDFTDRLWVILMGAFAKDFFSIGYFMSCNFIKST